MSEDDFREKNRKWWFIGLLILIVVLVAACLVCAVDLVYVDDLLWYIFDVLKSH